MFIELFFLISGFSMCCGYYGKIRNNEISIDFFYKRRYQKILPFFVLLIVLDIVANFAVDGEVSIVSLYEAFANVSLMFGFYSSGMNVIGVGWTLGVIFGFYILFPFYVFLIWTKRRAWVSLAVTMMINFICQVHFGLGMTFCFYWIYYFIAGGIIYLYRAQIENFVRKPSVGLIVTILGLVIAFIVPNPFEGNIQVITSMLKSLLGFCLVLVGALCHDNILWSNRVTSFLSSISLEIYLGHMLVFRVVQKAGFTTLLGESLPSYILACIFTILGVTIFAAGYWFIESKIKAYFGSR